MVVSLQVRSSAQLSCIAHRLWCSCGVRCEGSAHGLKYSVVLFPFGCDFPGDDAV